MISTFIISFGFLLLCHTRRLICLWYLSSLYERASIGTRVGGYHLLSWFLRCRPIEDPSCHLVRNRDVQVDKCSTWLSQLCVYHRSWVSSLPELLKVRSRGLDDWSKGKSRPAWFWIPYNTHEIDALTCIGSEFDHSAFSSSSHERLWIHCLLIMEKSLVRWASFPIFFCLFTIAFPNIKQRGHNQSIQRVRYTESSFFRAFWWFAMHYKVQTEKIRVPRVLYPNSIWYQQNCKVVATIPSSPYLSVKIEINPPIQEKVPSL